jgi:hypothetical protein
MIEHPTIRATIISGTPKSRPKSDRLGGSTVPDSGAPELVVGLSSIERLTFKFFKIAKSREKSALRDDENLARPKPDVQNLFVNYITNPAKKNAPRPLQQSLGFEYHPGIIKAYCSS